MIKRCVTCPGSSDMHDPAPPRPKRARWICCGWFAGTICLGSGCRRRYIAASRCHGHEIYSSALAERRARRAAAYAMQRADAPPSSSASKAHARLIATKFWCERPSRSQTRGKRSQKLCESALCGIFSFLNPARLQGSRRSNCELSSPPSRCNLGRVLLRR